MINADQISNCARILLATTGSWKPSDGSTSTLTDARGMLAPLIYASGGTGFPAPAIDDAIKQPDMQDAWKSCVAAARAAVDEEGNFHDPLGAYVVLWPADPDNPAKLGAGLGLNWPTQPDSHIARVSGPILDKDDPKPKRLFFFDSINEAAALEADADARPGFWPRVATKPADAAALAPAAAFAAEIIPKRLGLATFLFVLWIITGGALALWLWETGSAMQGAALNFKQTAGAACTTIPAGQKVIPWTSPCETVWQGVWQKLYPEAVEPAPNPPSAQAANILTNAQGILSSFRHSVGGLLWSAEGHISLLPPFVLTMASFVLLLLAVGLAKKGLWFGVLIDDRNRISMARTQQVAWTALLIGAMAIMGWFNSTGISLIDRSALHTLDLFPYMVPALWAALGINLIATPYLSNVILSSKEQKKDAAAIDPQPNVPAPTLAVRSIVTPASIATKRSATQAGWTDLITGETEGTDQAIDISRVQHLVISGALLTTYMMALADALGDVGGQSIMSAIANNKSIFTEMPGVGTGTFLGLLGISHAGYLIFKANASDGKPTDTPPPRN